MAQDRKYGSLYTWMVDDGYDSPTHWDETRFYNAKEKVADTLWDREDELRKRRVDITQNTWVELMRSIDF